MSRQMEELQRSVDKNTKATEELAKALMVRSKLEKEWFDWIKSNYDRLLKFILGGGCIGLMFTLMGYIVLKIIGVIK